MREILFRGQMYSQPYKVCGYLNQNFSKQGIEDESIDLETISIGDFYIYDLEDCKIYKVIPESIGEYTGFEDCNGEKIFEGDIIQNDKEKQYVVYWCDGGFSLKHIIYGRIDNRFNGTIHFNSDDCNINTFEIVGNIFDDYPELSKELNNTKEINMKYDLSKFPQRLRQARKNKGITQKELENLTGIDNANISKYETGDLTPGILILIILASKLNVSLDWLCGNDI